jgi:glutamate racemase
MRIGVFDSGVGGLTVLREIRRQCPGHSTLYLGDTARVPYGTKSPETVRRYAALNAEFLQHEGIDFLVIACNTAAAHAMDELEALPIPVVGVIEPGAQLAVDLAGALGPAARIGVLGTAGTVRSRAYEFAIRDRDAMIPVESLACPLFVPLAEEGWADDAIAIAAARKYLSPWIEPGAAKPNVVILGCTHYPLLKNTIQSVLGRGVHLIDSAEAVAADIARRIADESMESHPTHRLFLTDASEGFLHLAHQFLAEFDDPQLEIEWIDIALANAHHPHGHVPGHAPLHS